MLNVFLEKLSSPNKNLEINLKKGTTSIGRKDTDIIVSNSSVSSIHCEIHFSGTRVYVFDRNSTNGTFVNNIKVKKTSLKDGDIISIAGSDLNSAANYKIHILRTLNKDKIVYIEKEARKLKLIFFVSCIILLIVFIIWIMLPSSTEQAEQKLKIDKPWSNLQLTPSIPYTIGVERTIFFNDTIFLPPNYDWITEIKYELTEHDNIYEPRLYVLDIRNDLDDLKGLLTVQRFLSFFIGNLQDLIVNSFIWHETIFKKNNKLFFEFKYSKTNLGIWQWAIWQENDVYNLYAVCIGKRGRFILQASSYDSFMLDNFFHFLSQSYIEGSID